MHVLSAFAGRVVLLSEHRTRQISVFSRRQFTYSVHTRWRFAHYSLARTLHQHVAFATGSTAFCEFPEAPRQQH